MTRFPFRRALAAAALVALGTAQAQTQPPSGAAPDGGVQAVVVAQQSAPSFLESLAVGPDNALYATDFHGRQILRYVDGKGFTVLARLDVHPWGLAFDADGTLYFAAADRTIVDKTSPPVKILWRLARGEAPKPVLTIDDARALNGMALLAPGRLLIADGRGGVIWHVDLRSGTAIRWLRDGLLDAPSGFALPTPAANGLKIQAGWLYVSNTARQSMLRVRVGNDLAPAGAVETYAELVRADDFVFSPAGNLYYATQRTEVMRIAPDRRITAVPGIGPELIGSTALAWRPGDDGPFVINDGGFIAHYWYGGPPPAASNLVRLRGLE